MTMVWQYDVYALLLFFAASVSAGLALFMLRRWRFPDAAAFTVLLLMIAEWSLTDGLEYVSADLPSILFWDQAIYVGAAIVPVAFFVFVLLYTGRGKRLSLPSLVLLCFVPAVTVLLRWTNDTYHLFYSGYSLVTSGGLSILQVSFGVGFYVYAAYSYAIVLFGIALLVQQFLRSRVLRRQSVILIISAVVPLGASVLDLLPNVVFPFDWTPLAFAFTGLVYFWGVFRTRLFEFMPVAREAVVRGMGDGVIVLDSGNRIVDINPACEKMFGCGVEVLGRSAVEFFESRGLNGEYLVKESSEIVLPIKDARRYFDLNFSSLHDKRGALMGRIGVMRDITERKQMEEKLIESEEVLRRRAEELAALQATVLDMTDASYDLPNLLEVIVKRAVTLLDAKSGGLDLCDPEKHEVRCVVSYNTPQDFRGLVLKYGEGSSGLVAETRKPLIINDYRKWKGAAPISGATSIGAEISVPMIWRGQVTGIIQVAEDSAIRQFTQSDLDLLMLFANHAAIAVENGRRAEGLEQIVAERTKELIEAQDRLLKAERMAAIGETAAMVGHDLRNPLQAISTATYVLKKELTPSADAKTREMFEVIEDSVAYSDRIVRDLLDYSQELELELSEATPKLIASDAVRQVEIPANITISDLTLDEPKIRVDTAKIRRVFVNLIEDAVDAMPDGGKLTISSNRSDDFLIVKFADTGPGIPETVLRDLWKPLITTKSKGIGLGLAICKRIAEAHGGSITVESKIGEGTTFTLTLPISHSQEGAQTA